MRLKDPNAPVEQYPGQFDPGYACPILARYHASDRRVWIQMDHHSCEACTADSIQEQLKRENTKIVCEEPPLKRRTLR